MSASSSARKASRSSAFHASMARWTVSTFACDIAAQYRAGLPDPSLAAPPRRARGELAWRGVPVRLSVRICSGRGAEHVDLILGARGGIVADVDVPPSRYALSVQLRLAPVNSAKARLGRIATANRLL